MDKKNIARYQKKAIELSLSKGFREESNTAAAVIFKTAFSYAAAVFLGEIKKSDLCYIGLFRNDQQSNEYLADGWTFTHQRSDGLTASCIFLESATIKAGLPYILFLILHELAHVFSRTAAHNEVFEACLNELTDRFNKQTGFTLKNDFASYADGRYSKQENLNSSELPDMSRIEKMMETERGKEACALTDALMGGSHHDVD